MKVDALTSFPSEIEPGWFAFWLYDLYPGCLSGRITLIDHKAVRVEIESYNGRFHPFLVLPPATGEALHLTLKELNSAHREAAGVLHKNYRDQVKTALTAQGVKFAY